MLKAIILAGGRGSRLYPLTEVCSKQLLAVYDKPLIYYPLTTLIECGLREFCLISTPSDLKAFEKLLHGGGRLGISIQYLEQPKPGGIAQAFQIAESFIGLDNSTLILGDNIFNGSDTIQSAFRDFKTGATVFAHQVSDPKRYGVIEFDTHGNAISIEEKPKLPRSNYAVTGLYIFDNQIISIAKRLKPSARGELEITDALEVYMRRGSLRVRRLNRGFSWLDAGTGSTLHDASTYVQTVEKRTGIKLGCPEEAAFQAGRITREELVEVAKNMPQGEYRDYIAHVASESVIASSDCDA